jgi:cytochrome b561
MKLRDASLESEENADSPTAKVSPALSPSIAVWLLHWVSALLVLFLLTTSLTSGLGITTRQFPASWLDWHLSAGVFLLLVTVVRMKTSHPWNELGRVFSFRKQDTRAIKSVLLLVVLAVGVSGLTIFQKPPFGRSGILFGSYPMPTLLRLDHSIHNVIINLHIALSCIIAALIIVHVRAGLRRLPANSQSRLAIMLWPWRKRKIL